jgi:hypothetical protein
LQDQVLVEVVLVEEVIVPMLLWLALDLYPLHQGSP